MPQVSPVVPADSRGYSDYGFAKEQAMRPMHRIAFTVALTITSLGALTAAAQEATPPVPPAQAAPQAAAPGQPETARATGATRSRSNIQNNREAAPPATATDGATGDEPQAVIKTKTKSNQSND